MKQMKNIIIILFLILSNIIGLSQSTDELSAMIETTEVSNNEINYNFTLDVNNEIELLLSNSFIFYKKYVSSQDVGNCTFVPSCSVYAVDAMRNQGVVVGLINFFDRYTRCHPYSIDQYELNREHMLMDDPVRSSKYEHIH